MRALCSVAVASVVLVACDSGQRGTVAVEATEAQGVEADAVVTTSAQPVTLADIEDAIPDAPLKAAYFGEIHVHTSYSLDAYIAGTRLTPDSAYRFARGESMIVNGRRHSIARPLDFAAVTDHAEYIGEMYSAQVKGAKGYNHPQLKALRSLQGIEKQEAWFLKYVVGPARSGEGGHPPFYAGQETSMSAWQLAIQAAIDNYEPGVFSTLAGFEWSAAPGGGNMHRNVLFRDLDLPELPFSAIDSSDEEKLWDWMEEQEAAGRRLTAIPHNSNASKGLMFELVDNSGNPISAVYAERRSHFERVVEIMQIKGNSEVHRKFWPADEFADFENADSIQDYSDRTFRKGDFVRAALVEGVNYDRLLGQNPFKLGFVGGSDSHNGTPADVAEDNYIGSHGAADDTVERRRNKDIAGWVMAKDSNPGALTGVWANKNTRGDIWDALRQRETFATSGTRIKPRFFGGVGLVAEDAQALVRQGYEEGVPMGGELSGLRTPPSFTVHALKDPDGANLDRIQIIKSWIDVASNPQEKIVDVAWSDKREPDIYGILPPVGNTVDLSDASYTNTIGSAELMGSWIDYDFDPQLPAVYYARVLEIPTPRWSTYDAVKNNLPLLEDVPATVQERAWTSPIWYTP
ncbi:MAG: DUF3604 domain-containing protein [Halioglobus sp.]|nr:DUF3604 domain-containing protein [Halioglobus sp.]